MTSHLVCAGCWGQTPDDGAEPFRCAAARPGDDIDHVLTVVLDRLDETDRAAFGDPEPNPFIRYRSLTHTYRTARARGMTDLAFVDVVRRLDERVREVDGRGFVATPFFRADALARRIGSGPLWVKNETGNVSGSHKGRHLMGLALWLEITACAKERSLAIASCGNAALAAAVVAKAASRPLDVFIPPDANPNVVDRLASLGARLTRCPRDASESGDPCVHRFREAVAKGAIPFTCQGNENGLCIEGGQTLAWEIASDLAREGTTLDTIVIQVGGGALASSVMQGFATARKLGVIAKVPRLHTVQTAGAAPLSRAVERVATRVLETHARETGKSVPTFADPAARAEWIRANVRPATIETELHHAATHRSQFMWPWETEPKSIAHGILDDETYDWLAITRAMLLTGGTPLVVDEPTLAEATTIAKSEIGIAADATGAAGLAGAIDLARRGARPNESLAVLLTGRER
ncbi:MAG: pyridoxal-phosphate dependent enzyme [Planctomycetes bacterium]|nr:pyridoxal-phosphate dependent enzyme [Planctomycetota bacterium]